MNQSGGDSDKLYTILQLEKILYLPKSNLFNNETTDKYMNSIDSYTLIYLIEKLELYNVDSINRIFKPSMYGGNEDPEINPDIIQNQSTSDPEQQPMEQQPMEQQPMEQQPIEQQPMEQQPMEQPMEQLMEQQPMEQQLMEQQPMEQQSMEQQSMEQQSIEQPMEQPMEQPDTDERESENLESNIQDEDLDNTKYETMTSKTIDPNVMLKVPMAPEDTNYELQYDDLKKAVDKAQEKILEIQKSIAEKDIKLKDFHCVKNDSIGEYFNLFDYILDCSNICIKDINWYNVIINQEKLDNEYELSIERDNTNYLGIDVEELDSILSEFVDDNELEDIFRNRIVECAYMEPVITYPQYPDPPQKPDSDIKELVEKYNKEIEEYNSKYNKPPEPIIEEDECHKCLNDCILYLNPSYKGFLYKNHDRVNTVEKLRMLVYCELRLNKFMKYLKLESDRLFNKNYQIVTDILLKIKDKENEFQDIRKNKDIEIEKNTADLADLNSKLADKKKELSNLITKINEYNKSGGAEGDIEGSEIVNNPIDLDSESSEPVDLDSEPVDLDSSSDDLGSSSEDLESSSDDLESSSDDLGSSGEEGIAESDDTLTSYYSSTDDDDDVTEYFSTEEEESSDNDIDTIPSCKVIAEDIKKGIIKRENFIYLTNKCLEEVDNALRS